jgi:hypothetical protein
MNNNDSSESIHDLYNPNFLDGSNKNLVESFIVRNNINIDYVRSLAPEERNIFLISSLFTVEDLLNTSNEQYRVGIEEPFDDDYGMIIIKPEMFPCIKDIERFLGNMGVECCSLECVMPTKRDWLDTYGYMLVNFPNIVNVYITQRSFGVRPILFRHLSIDEYGLIADKRGLKLDTRDKDTAFDQLYCGKVKSGFDGTIRHDVVLPKLASLGFNNMSGYAADFDISNYYKDSDPARTYASFNGIHSPKNKNEKEKNIQTYITPRSIV